ncbi:MAG: OsmC family protein [SAR202 cluster bacterium]|nr:OsmC family protein [SAR202 cluster bacterium]
MTILLYCRRKNWDLIGISVTCILDENHARILNKTEQEQTAIGTISVTINLKSNLGPDQISKIENISAKCPVHKALERSYDISHKIES